MNFLILVGVVVLLILVCSAAMAVGLLQNKTFRNCGCASLTIRGEKIRCPGCTEPDEACEQASKSASAPAGV